MINFHKNDQLTQIWPINTKMNKFLKNVQFAKKWPIFTEMTNIIEVTKSDKSIKFITKKDIEKYPVQRGPGGETFLAGGAACRPGAEPPWLQKGKKINYFF